MDITDLTNLEWAKARQSSGTAGSYLKSYSYSHGIKVYYKLSFYDDLNGIFGYEAINEIIAMELAKKLNYPYLEYKLLHAKVRINNKEYITYVTSSYDFKKLNESKITLENYYEYNKLNNEDVISFLKRIDLNSDIYKMLIFDYLIMNRDRHGANIEILYDKKSKNIRLAPFFDQGLSLLSPAYLDSDIISFDITKETKVNSFIASSSLVNNLDLVPTFYFPLIKIDFDEIFDKIGIDNIYTKKAKEMLKWRWKTLESIRDKRYK